MNKWITKVITASAAGLVAGGAMAEEASWADKISMKGDLRFRYENIDKEGSAERDRLRIRARFELNAEANDELDVKIRLASGSSDPVSSNQTLGDSFSTKAINLDRAYFDYHPDALEGVSFLGGKMANPFSGIKTGLVWDGDLNPEGLAVEWELGGDAAEFFINAGGFAVEERKAASDTWLFGVLAGADLDLEVTSLELGLGYYLYDGMKGQTVLVDEADDFGNSSVEVLDADGEVESLQYISDYAMVDAFVRAKFDVGMPLYAYGEFVNNTDAETDADTGYIVGLTLGKAKAPGSWALDYNYRDLEADSTVAAFSDSDSGGGGTNHKGHRIKAKYQMAKNWQLALTYYNNTIDPDGSGKDYARTQLDLVAKF